MRPAPPPPLFGTEDRETLHRLLAARRDMRHFVPGQPVAPEVLQRLLQAAHHAPSVGLMQPWRILRITDPALRQAIAGLVEEERLATAEALGERSAEFLRLKVEGVHDCAELLVALLAPDDGTVFGRRTMPRDMALCSVACAIQNLWLAARAENLGLGWVSMFDPARLGALLQAPTTAQPVALLCLGPVPAFYDEPMLEAEGWRFGRPLEEMVFTDRWPSPASPLGDKGT
ncbi:MAG: 5,6-dimethylbenzimidazole synthase [Pseudomonadota bacterium]